MTKSKSLLNAATLAHRWETAIIESRDSADFFPFWTRLENLVFDIFKPNWIEYGQLDIETQSDSAGTSMTVRVGDHHAVSYWDGEDIIFIYECSRDTDLSEALTGNPIYSITL